MKICRAAHFIDTEISNYRWGENKTTPLGEKYWDQREAHALFELKDIERKARNCYKSEDRISDDEESAKKLIKNLIDNGHEAMLEHSILSVKFVCDRAVSHELVRHRMASFSQESQRYCNYSKGKFEGNVTFVMPSWMDEDEDDLGYTLWKEACEKSEKAYFEMLNIGYLPEQARSVLNNSVKTWIYVTANYREWRHILKLRTAKDAHPDMRALMIPLLKELKVKIPVVFDDIPDPEVRK